MHLPKLPPNASYIYLNNPKRRNALSIAVLQELKNKLVQSFTSPSSGQLRILPPFKKDILSDLEYAARRENRESEQWKKYGWLVDASEWRRERADCLTSWFCAAKGPSFVQGMISKNSVQ